MGNSCPTKRVERAWVCGRGCSEGPGSMELGGRVGAEGGASGCSSSRCCLCPGASWCGEWRGPGSSISLGMLLGKQALLPAKGRRLLWELWCWCLWQRGGPRGPDAGVQARVPVQVTENRPIGTCTAYPGLLEQGHGLARALVLLLAPVASFPQDRVCLIPAPCPGVS